MYNRMAFLCLPLLLSGAVIVSACAADIHDSGYAFDRPDRIFELPDALDEISGLTLLDDRHLGAIHDDSSDLFVIDVRTGAVTERYDMGNKRDYEDVERVGDTVYVLASNGTIYAIEEWKKNQRITARYKTGLGREHDTEGLAYDAKGNRLLILCKEYAGKGLKGYKAIYAFDLKRKQLLPAPAFRIDIAQAEEAAKSGRVLPAGQIEGEGWWGRKKEIKPAALALHPLTGQLFVISSTKRRIIVLNGDGSLAAAYKLPKKYFVQAEGLAFLPNGDLFISNEKGKRKSATLLRFSYRAP